MGTRLGNHFLDVADKARVLEHQRRTQSTGGLFYQDELDFARRMKQTFPRMNVVLRHYPDAETHRQMTPGQWLRERGPLSAGGLLVQTTNEPGFGQDVIDWHTELLERIKADRWDVYAAILGLSVGTPGPDNDWPRAKRLLQLASELRSRVVINLHEYFGGVITSGFIGGNPTMIQRDTWPEDTSKLTLWHVGRYRFMFKYCRANGIPVPRVIISEFGADFVGDIGDWLKTLPSSSGQYDSVDGWHDLWGQWKSWWPMWSSVGAYMAQAVYADQHIYIDPEVESILFYAFGDDGNWGKYRTDGYLDDEMEKYAAAGGYFPTSPVPPPPPPPPVITTEVIPLPTALLFPAMVTMEGKGNLPVRTGPSTHYQQINNVKAGDVLIAFQGALGQDRDLRWIYIQTKDGVRGWIALLPEVKMSVVGITPTHVSSAHTKLEEMRRAFLAVYANVKASAALNDEIQADCEDALGIKTTS